MKRSQFNDRRAHRRAANVPANQKDEEIQEKIEGSTRKKRASPSQCAVGIKVVLDLLPMTAPRLWLARKDIYPHTRPRYEVQKKAFLTGPLNFIQPIVKSCVDKN